MTDLEKLNEKIETQEDELYDHYLDNELDELDELYDDDEELILKEPNIAELLTPNYDGYILNEDGLPATPAEIQALRNKASEAQQHRDEAIAHGEDVKTQQVARTALNRIAYIATSSPEYQQLSDILEEYNHDIPYAYYEHPGAVTKTKALQEIDTAIQELTRAGLHDIATKLQATLSSGYAGMTF